MKILKYIFFLLLLCVIAGAVYIGTKNSSYDFTSQKIVNAPQDLVYSTLTNFEGLSQWNPYEKETKSFHYLPVTVKDQKMGSWEIESETYQLETIQKIPLKKIKHQLKSPDQDTLNYEKLIWSLDKIQDTETKIVLEVKGELTFKDKIFQLFSDQELEEKKQRLIQRGFEKLEAYLQVKMNEYSVDIIGTTEYGGGFYMYTATASTISAMPQKLSEMLPVVQAYVSTNNIAQTGKPFTIYNDFNTDLGTTIFSAAVPVRDRVITPANSTVLCDFMPRQRVVKTVLKGDYKYLMEAWEKTRKYLKKQHISINTTLPAFEIYQVDPSVQANPAEWITELYIPIQTTDKPQIESTLP